MLHSMKLGKGIVRPFTHFRTLRSAYRIKGSWWRLFLLALLAFLVTAATTFLNIKYAGELPEYAGLASSEKLLFVLSEVISDGILAILVFLSIILVGALLFWPFFQDVGYKRLAFIHSYGVFILLIGMILQLPFIMFLHEPSYISPFSIGVYIDLFVDDSFWLYFSYSLSLFFVWLIIVQYAAIYQSTSRRRGYIVTWIIILDIVLAFAMAYIRTAF
ncbi:hypothetical protein [Alkalihalobacillus sp. CinArs1]|uniref:hypothetical protein n=1 Tax=Alkalihalobacillus sp. CinArs1 TaxID=2995314 RepID=UPI0022DD3471|nr:hypothetical protein [Alkalihalobacillus sp. CinArs1]